MVRILDEGRQGHVITAFECKVCGCKFDLTGMEIHNHSGSMMRCPNKSYCSNQIQVKNSSTSEGIAVPGGWYFASSYPHASFPNSKFFGGLSGKIDRLSVCTTNGGLEE